MASSMSATTKLIAQLRATMTRTVESVEVRGELDHKVELALSNGIGASKANLVVEKSGTIAASASTNIDLAGSLTDIFGMTVTLAKIKGLIVENTSDDLSTPTDAILHVGAGATPFLGPIVAATDKVEVEAGGFVAFGTKSEDGWPVAAGASDILMITNIDGVDQAQYRVTVVGEAA